MSWTLPLTRQHPPSAGSAHQVSAKSCVKSLHCGQQNQSWKCEGAVQSPLLSSQSLGGVWNTCLRRQKPIKHCVLLGRRPQASDSAYWPQTAYCLIFPTSSAQESTLEEIFLSDKVRTQATLRLGGGWRKSGCSPFRFHGHVDLYCHQHLI